MKRLGKLGALLISVVLVSPTLAHGADIPDEQLMTPRPPVEQTGGYSGAYYDDQKTLFRAFTYLEAWGSSNYAESGAITCKSADEAPCSTSNYVFF